jgi:hypothetical protein
VAAGDAGLFLRGWIGLVLIVLSNSLSSQAAEESPAIYLEAGYGVGGDNRPEFAFYCPSCDVIVSDWIDGGLLGELGYRFQRVGASLGVEDIEGSSRIRAMGSWKIPLVDVSLELRAGASRFYRGDLDHILSPAIEMQLGWFDSEVGFYASYGRDFRASNGEANLSSDNAKFGIRSGSFQLFSRMTCQIGLELLYSMTELSRPDFSKSGALSLVALKTRFAFGF